MSKTRENPPPPQIRQRPGAATFWKGCFWGYPYQTEFRNSINCRSFLQEFGSVPRSPLNAQSASGQTAQPDSLHKPDESAARYS
jgi:hypothetical protein